MELIDRQALIKQLKDENIPFNADINEIINIQPIAFDTEKVFEWLDNVLRDLNVIEILSQFDPDSTIQTSLDRFLNDIRNEVLNIIKKGGTE